MGAVYWGSFRDAPLATSVSGAPTGQPARRTKIATYYGSSFVAERSEDGDLHVYHVGTGVVSSNLVGDSAPGCGCGGPHQRVDAKRMQEIILASRRRAGER